MTNWQNPDDVETGLMYIAWINGTMLPSFMILSKDVKQKSGKIKWTNETSGQKIPRKWIAAVHELPDPREIGPNWMGNDD